MQNWLDPKSLQASTQGLFNGIDKVSESFEPWFKAVARCQLEAIGLASRRAQAYMELPAKLGACRTPQDLAREQIGFWQTAFAQYAESCGRMFDTCRALTPPWSLFSAGGERKEPGKRERDYMSVRDSEEEQEQAAAGKSSRRAA
ncbi:MAG TPA: hypothetical protein VNK52_14785 [Hyphomicrobiaceae bacterium]|nr:hypothetical protein [Hyphomicrobiaceae bacterium]